MQRARFTATGQGRVIGRGRAAQRCTCMTTSRHLASAGSAPVAGMSATASFSAAATALLAGAWSANSKEPKGTVTEAGSAIDLDSLPLKPASQTGGRLRMHISVTAQRKEPGIRLTGMWLPRRCSLLRRDPGHVGFTPYSKNTQF